MLELLLAPSNIASELLERTSSTPNTLRAVQLSLAPAFLLVGIGSILNVMVARVTWIAGRIERLNETEESKRSAQIAREIEWLSARRSFARRAIMFATASAMTISVVVAVLFSSVYVETKLGTLVAALWVLTMGLLIAALTLFLRETLLAARGPEPKESKL
ncbi:MAG: DUF2721 domain-containing protein [Erythrobacter sp.]|uniref:DUF2721 domain-containing protein n=1 Tax=Erythrobacter sp. TaxID=1042 RepID=UPI002624A307|nr:DUF2721 domain-containing protein [Erythrobacter sp.]MDJ0978910.1 DUF2721 domain-containing protein [Erythrobacter sp.]